MPTIRGADILVAVAMFSAVVVSALAVDPKGFSLKDWQPLMASVIALFGASLVYRGAILAYRAAMSKVDFDHRARQEEIDRTKRGAFLRTQYAALVTRDEAKACLLSDTLIKGAFEKRFDPTSFRMRASEAIDQAWSNLEVFPIPIAN